MNMKKIKIILSSLLILIAFCGCDENMRVPIEKNGNAPGMVEVTYVENIAGGAYIVYNVPDDPDLLCVVARYEEKGVRREFKASYYTNYLKVEGLSREEKYQVEVVAVNRSNKESKPVVIEIEPLTPPVMVAFASLKQGVTYGGIEVFFDNPSYATIAIGVLTTDSIGRFYERDTHYTSQESGKFSVRGFQEEERVFKAYVKDRWGNYSDTITFDPVTPIGERLLDKSLFRAMSLKGDAITTEWGGQMQYIWDDRRFGDAEGQWGLHTGNATGGEPRIITFDLGVNATLSRFALWQILDDKHMYDDMCPRKYEVWGRYETIDPVTDSGNIFDGKWVLMATLENSKPSGLPTGSLTDDDRAAARAGDEAIFEYNEFTARYIRVRCLLNWSNNYNMCFSEVSLWATKITPLQ